jgi:hypothetical protein
MKWPTNEERFDNKKALKPYRVATYMIGNGRRNTSSRNQELNFVQTMEKLLRNFCSKKSNFEWDSYTEVITICDM